MMKPPLPIFSLNSKIFQAMPPPLSYKVIFGSDCNCFQGLTVSGTTQSTFSTKSAFNGILPG